MGEGDAETETTHIPEGRQTAARKYSEQYQKYRRMSRSRGSASSRFRWVTAKRFAATSS